VFKETKKWAYELVELAHRLEVKRLERLLARKLRDFEAAEEALQLYDEKKAAEKTS
jgi:predicted RNA polymerase sigma factor